MRRGLSDTAYVVRVEAKRMDFSQDPIRLDTLDDAALIRAYRASEHAKSAILERLLLRHEKQLYATCLRMVGSRETARDLTQETFVRIIGAIDSFDERAKFTTWMTRIAINGAISHLRKQKHRRMASLDDAGADGVSRGEILQSVEPQPNQRVQLDEDLRWLAEAMGSIEPDQRAILLLRDARGLEYREIAEVIGVAVGTVKSRLFRARQALRQAVETMENAGQSPATKDEAS